MAFTAMGLTLILAGASAQTAGTVSPTPGGMDTSGGGGTGRERDMSNAIRAAAGRTEAPAGVGAGTASGTAGGGVDSGSPR